MKNKIINFEMLHVSETERRDCITSNLESAKAQGYSTVYGLLLMDGFLYRDPETFPVDINVKLIAGMCEHPDHLYFNYTHRMVYNSFKNTKLPPWMPKNKSFLFLGGVPSRPNRINLLSKFYDADMLTDTIYSFFPPWTDDDKERCRNFMMHYTDSQYDTFLTKCTKSIDYRYEVSKNYSRLSRKEWDEQNVYDQPWVKDLAWINPNVFIDTVLSVISEGNAYSPASNFKFLTEKTWRTIAMRHPFVFAGYPEQFDYAKSLGLKTFEEYMLIKDYAYIVDEDARLDAIVINTKYFIENYNNHKEQICIDTEHNYKLFMDIGKEQDMFLNLLDIDEDEKTHWFGQTGFSHLIKVQNGN